MGIDHRLRVVNLYNGLQPFTKEKYKVVSRLAFNEDIKISHDSVIKSSYLYAMRKIRF